MMKLALLYMWFIGAVLANDHYNDTFEGKTNVGRVMFWSMVVLWPLTELGFYLYKLLVTTDLRDIPPRD